MTGAVDLLAAAGRQAMHEPGVRRARHQRFVDLVRLEQGAALVAVFAAHRDPDVAVDDVRAFDGFLGIGERALEAMPRRAGDHEFGTGERARLGQRARHIVALTDEGDANAFEAAEELLDRQQIRQRLERVVGGREHVEHRRRVQRRHLLEQAVIEDARCDDRVITGERSSHVGDALATADAELVLLDIDGCPPSCATASSIELRVRALGFSK